MKSFSYFCATLISMLIIVQLAHSFEHPVWPYTPGSYDGRSFFYDEDHLGEDIKLPEGTAIRAIGDGIVKKYGPADGYGELVVVIEHELPHLYTFTNAYGKDVATTHILSIYGHLRKSEKRGGQGLNLSLWEGKYIDGGTVIGFINDGEHNGDGGEHLHMGIRLSDARTAASHDPSAWFRGYEKNTHFGDDFAAASKVLDILTQDAIGYFANSRETNSWRKDGFSLAFFNAYQKYGGNAKLGLSFDNGGSIYVHQWPADDLIHNVLIQDFLNENPNTRYGTDGQTALIYNRGINKCYLVKEGMWGLYKPPKFDLPSKYGAYLHGLFGPHDLGAPKTDEYQEQFSNDIVQEFDRGELRFSQSQNEWTIKWYNDPIAGWKANQPYRLIPQWEQISTLQKMALISSTLIHNFWAKVTGGSNANMILENVFRPMASQNLDFSWQIESPPPGGKIDLLYSLSGELPFTQAIVRGLEATISGNFNGPLPSGVSGKIWIQMLVLDGDGMIVESEISEFPLVEPPTPTPTFTPTPTNTRIPPTPTFTPTPKSPAPLSGTVTDISTGRPIANAIVSIAGGKSTATNPKGEFEFASLSAGVYDITISKTGYKTSTFTNVIIMPGQPTALTVELTTPGLLNIETTSLPPAEIGLPYNPKVHATGGTPPYSYQIAAGKIPDGLQLDAVTGNISGMPSLAGSFTFAVGVRDKLGAYAEQQFTLVVTNPLAIETESPLPRGTKGIAYFQSIDISGGVPPYSFLAPDSPPFPESTHPYYDHEYRSWVYSIPANPNEIRVTFDARTKVETGYDYIYVKDGNGNNIPGSPFTGTQLSGQTVTVPGAKVVITLTTDGSVTDWGFKVTSISPSHPAGSLPPGLAIDSSGNLTGIPAQTGAFSFTIYVTDSQGRAAEKQFNVEFSEPLIITTERLNDGIVGRVYNQKLEAAGGEGQLRWEVYSGLLPLGLMLDSQSGMLLGTPLESTYGSIVLAVSDAEGRIVYKDYTLKVSEPLRLEVSSLPNALINETYSELIRVQGGWEPYAFTIEEGSLPDGLTSDPNTGTLSGIPASPQLKNFQIRVTDSSYPATQSISQVLNIRVTSDLTITSSAVLPNEKKGVEVNPVVLIAKGGPSPYRWNLLDGFIPDGIQIAEEGILSGTPTVKGDYVFTLQAADANGKTAEKEFVWHISDDLTIVTYALPDAAKDKEYKHSLEAKGGIPPYSWRMKSGTLPDGLTFASNGTIQGKPARKQTFSFTVEVNDHDSPAQTTQLTYIMDVLDTLFIATRTIPNARVNQAYSAAVRAELGTPPYQWSLQSGVLPSGVELISTLSSGRLEGTPLEPGTYAFTIQVNDSGTPVQTRTFDYAMEVYGKVNIDTAELKSAYPGVPYSAHALASGGQLPYVWSLAEGALPNGLQLNPSSGHISGITTLGVGQSSEFRLRVIDSGIPSGFDEKTLVIKVIEGIEITTFDIPKAMQFIPYSAILEAQGGISPYSWSVGSGNLPQGMALDPIAGELSGEPWEFGDFDFMIRMTDSSHPAYTSTRAYIWTIVKNPFQEEPITQVEDWMAYN